MEWILPYLIVMNITGLGLMARDKEKAKRKQWRIPEMTMFVVAILGGSLGCWGGMYLFFHKTRKPLFVIGMPVIVLVQILLLLRWA